MRETAPIYLAMDPFQRELHQLGKQGDQFAGVVRDRQSLDVVGRKGEICGALGAGPTSGV